MPDDDLPTLTRPPDEPGRVPWAAGRLVAERYRIDAILGSGGMGQVWLAFDLRLRVEVALKLMLPERFTEERTRELLRREVLAARQVISPNVCRVFDLVTADDRELLVMEYVDGQTFLELLEEKGPLDARQARELASQLLTGLEAIHEAGLIHRDLKPENVMVTRTGRVVVMDLGLAKAVESEGSMIAGTPPYMAPEQLRGEQLDRRADVFAAGVMLAEMVNEDGIGSIETRRQIWEGVRATPPRVPVGPWEGVISKAVAAEPKDRYPSAAALARALEEGTIRVAGAEEESPYPGLASFTEAEAEYFFGREAEVEEMWKKLRQPHLLALIGPSGAGKSSFLRAGLLPSKPERWTHLVCQPGDAPFGALAQALVPELSGDTDAMKELLRFEEPEAAAKVIARWRSQATEAILIVDQFEELFTLNPQEVQARFAALLGRLAVESDVHVLLSMRDDFLLYCHDHEPLTPIFSELTPLKAPTGPALRRALVQPALACGYRFEDDSMVDEMLDEVANERGALPLLAFAASRLWERRDRETGTLTREAYEEIGGVGGALAQHAEATLERLGESRREIVREVFRNLVTAEGTRATREMGELLSVFEEAEAAREVVTALVDARLLTSYDVVDTTGDEEGSQRVEIVHESLLDAWPRLVRWRTQDEDGAQLRDLLRQGAKMWDERGRPDDLLWTGSAYFDYRAWRERYEGGLSDTEEGFTEAMTTHAGRKRRQRRIAVSVFIVILFAVLGTISLLWRQSESAKKDVIDEALRTEASMIAGLGREELDRDPSVALAFALSSLELADSHQGRQLALSAIWRGPTSSKLPNGAVRWSPDGRWLAIGTEGRVDLFSEEGGEPSSRKVVEQGGVMFEFSSDSRILTTYGGADRVLRRWSVPDFEPLGELEGFGDEGRVAFVESRDEPGALLVFNQEGENALVRSWSLERGEKVLGRVPGWSLVEADGSGRWIVSATGRDLYRRSIEELETGEPQLMGSHGAPIVTLAVCTRCPFIATADAEGGLRLWSLEDGGSVKGTTLDGYPSRSVPKFGQSDRWLASSDGGKTIRVWSLEEITEAPTRILTCDCRLAGAEIGPNGDYVAAWGTGEEVSIWRLDGPPEAEPLVLRRGSVGRFHWARFHPSGDWLVTNDFSGNALWPLSRQFPHVLRFDKGVDVSAIGAAPDNSWIAAHPWGPPGLRVWPIDGGHEVRTYPRGAGHYGMAVHPDGQSILGGGNPPTPVRLVPLDGGEPRVLSGFNKSRLFAVAFSPDGKLAAAAGGWGARSEGVIRIWNLESGESRVLDPGTGKFISHIQFTSDGRLLSFGGDEGVRLWDIMEGTSRILWEGPWEYGRISILPNGREVAVVATNISTPLGTLQIVDLEGNVVRSIESHGDSLHTVDVGSDGKLITGDWVGGLRVGGVMGEAPHLLLGHDGRIWDVLITPDGKHILTGGEDGTARLWPMPDVNETPFQELSHEELMARIRSFTNLRVVKDDEAELGYVVQADPFGSWAEVPRW